MLWAEREASREPEKAYPLPEECRFYDLERAKDIYYLLEGFADGFGGWKVTDVLGVPLVELPETLVSDLMMLRRFRGIAERTNEQKKEPGKQ